MKKLEFLTETEDAMKFVCYMVIVVAVILTIGTYGAIECETISASTGYSRCAIFIAAAFFAAIVAKED